jgi:universal stress protein A
MAVYHHALVLINSSQDGVPLLQHAARMAENGMRITIAHISTDYRALNYVSDSLRDDRVSEVIQAKALLNELACTVSLLVDTLSLVTTAGLKT